MGSPTGTTHYMGTGDDRANVGTCETCHAFCDYDSRFCHDHGGPPLTHWRKVFAPRMQAHLIFCEHYATEFAHGAPGHNDMMLIAHLVRFIETALARVEPKRQIVTWDEETRCHRDIITGVKVDLRSAEMVQR